LSPLVMAVGGCICRQRWDIHPLKWLPPPLEVVVVLLRQWLKLPLLF